MKQPKVVPDDTHPERALISQQKRLNVVHNENTRMQLEIETLRMQQLVNDKRAKEICAEIARLEKLIREKGEKDD